MKVPDQPVSVNPILRECESIHAELQELQTKRDNLQAARQRTEARINKVAGEMIGKWERQQRLLNAANVLEPDWREFPWVQEAGLDKIFPK